MPSLLPRLIRVELLRPTVRLLYEDGSGQEVTSKQAVVLAHLAVNPNGRVSHHQLLQAAWPDGGDKGNLTDVLKKLRKERGVPIPKANRDLNYWIEFDRAQVDATELIDGLKQLDERPGPSEIDPLLLLWHGEPAALGDFSWWRPIRRAHTRLADVVRALPVADRARLANLDDFVTRHHGTPFLPIVDGLDVVRPQRRRLLIVEDNPNLARTLMTRLHHHYECTLISSFEGWERLVEQGIPRFDGALVDRHLSAGGDDYGLRVLEYLRDHTDTRVILITVDPPPGFEADAMAEYRLVGVYRNLGRRCATSERSWRGSFPRIRRRVELQEAESGNVLRRTRWFPASG